MLAWEKAVLLLLIVFLCSLALNDIVLWSITDKEVFMIILVRIEGTG